MKKQANEPKVLISYTSKYSFSKPKFMVNIDKNVTLKDIEVVSMQFQ